MYLYNWLLIVTGLSLGGCAFSCLQVIFQEMNRDEDIFGTVAVRECRTGNFDFGRPGARRQRNKTPRITTELSNPGGRVPRTFAWEILIVQELRLPRQQRRKINDAHLSEAHTAAPRVYGEAWAKH